MRRKKQFTDYVEFSLRSGRSAWCRANPRRVAVVCDVLVGQTDRRTGAWLD